MKTKAKKTSAKIKKNKTKSEPLTLKMFADYNQKVLLPALEEKFVAKEEFNNFKDRSLTNQDAILKDLSILLAEKEVGEYQKEKERKMWIIIINSLKEHHILSSREMEKIATLDVF